MIFHSVLENFLHLRESAGRVIISFSEIELIQLYVLFLVIASIGVYTTSIDAEQGKVTVSGNVDPATLIKKLAKSGKYAELWSTPKGGNNNQLNNQFQKMQIDNNKGQKDAKGQKGGKDQKGAPQQLPLPPLKDHKSVKFSLPADDDEFSDELYDYDDEDDEYDDEFDDDYDDDEELLKAQAFKDFKMKPGSIPGHGLPLMNGAPAMNDKKAGGGGGGGGGGGHGNNKNAPSKGNNNDGKNINGGGKKGSGGNNGGGNPNQHQQNQGGGGGGKNGGKNGGDNKNPSNNSGGGGNNNNQGGVAKKGNGGGNLAGMDMKAGLGAMAGQMGNLQMPPAGNMPAVQGLPTNYQAAAPEMLAAANPYQQQQYLASMMMQQQLQQQQLQQQRINNGFQPMMYARPPPAVAYASPYMYQPPQYHSPGPEYSHFFSDENANSCSVM